MWMVILSIWDLINTIPDSKTWRRKTFFWWIPANDLFTFNITEPSTYVCLLHVIVQMWAWTAGVKKGNYLRDY